MKHNVNLMAMTAVLSSVLVLSGCGAMSTAIKKRNPEVKTQMSETICGLAPIFPYTFYHLTHYWFAAADIPV
ncbi:hypothetical protein QU919_27610, partial [Citrobacter freundii]